MRISIFSIFTAIGFYLNYFSRKMVENEINKKRIFSATVIGSHHILFNIMKHFITLKKKATSKQGLDEQDLV